MTALYQFDTVGRAPVVNQMPHYNGWSMRVIVATGQTRAEVEADARRQCAEACGIKLQEVA